MALGAPRSVVTYFRRVIIHKITRSKAVSAIKIAVVNMRFLELEVWNHRSGSCRQPWDRGSSSG